MVTIPKAKKGSCDSRPLFTRDFSTAVYVLEDLLLGTKAISKTMQQTVPENFLFVILLSKQFRKFTPAAYYSGVSNNIFLKRLTFALDALVYLLG